MSTAGIDVGAKNVKVVIVNDGNVVAKSITPSGFETKKAVDKALNDALKQAGLSKDDLEKIGATGAGRKEVTFTDKEITEVSANARGTIHVYPGARTVIDVGAEEGRGMRCDENGKIIDFAINEKCAAGAGSFTESMARALELPLEDIGELSLKSQRSIPMNAQCAVFAESEVVSLVHASTPKEDIARAVHDAIASRIVSMVRRVGVQPEIVLIGGLAHNVGFVDSLKRALESDVLIPNDPMYIGALGAALTVSS